MMRYAAFLLIALSMYTVPAEAQTRSHWGIVGGFAPVWETTPRFETLTTLLFDDTMIDLLKGSEFRIGIARGRRLSGDWGVSFIRKRINDGEPTVSQTGRGCQGGSAPGGPFILDCETSNERLRPDALQMSGVEFHKYVAFATIKERVQIGMNFAGGIVVGQGGFTSESFSTTYRCTFPPGSFPDYTMEDDPCAGGVKGPETLIPGDTSTQPFSRILNADLEQIPIGKVEIAGTVIVTPQLKVRVGGGLNYPGRTMFNVTGIYFFGQD